MGKELCRYLVNGRNYATLNEAVEYAKKVGCDTVVKKTYSTDGDDLTQYKDTVVWSKSNSESKQVKESLNSDRVLNEGAGAGYTIKGNLSNINITKINKVDVKAEPFLSGTLDYGYLEVEGTANFEGYAESYYYGITVCETPVAITQVNINGNLLDANGIDSYDEVTVEMLNDALYSCGEFESDTIGGGWSHTTFDGEAFGEVYQTSDEVDEIGFSFTDEDVIRNIDTGVSGETYTEYCVYDEDWEMLDSFEDEDEAIEWAKKNRGVVVEEQTMYLADTEGNWEYCDENETVWERESTKSYKYDESKKTRANKKELKEMFEPISSFKEYTYVDKTNQGWEIKKAFRDKDDDRLHIVVYRPKRNDYAVGLGYSPDGGYWNQGWYDYKNIEDAISDLKNEYNVEPFNLKLAKLKKNESLKEEYPNDDSTITNDYWIRGWHFIVYPERQSRKYWLYRPDTDKSKAQGGQVTYYGEGKPLEKTIGWDGNTPIPNDVLKKIVGIIYKNERRLKLWYDESLKEDVEDYDLTDQDELQTWLEEKGENKLERLVDNWDSVVDDSEAKRVYKKIRNELERQDLDPEVRQAVIDFFKQYDVYLESVKKDSTSKKPLKEDIYEDDPDFDICCQEVADALDSGWWHGMTSSERKWGLIVNGGDGNQFSPSFADAIAYECSYPVRDGYFSFNGLDCVPNKSTFAYTDFDDEDDREILKNDLLSVGCDEEEIEKFFNDEIDEIEFYIDYEIDIDDLEETYADDEDIEYDRRYVEKEYGLEEGELDGVSIRDAEDMLGLEEGELDSYAYFDESLKSKSINKRNSRKSMNESVCKTSNKKTLRESANDTYEVQISKEGFGKDNTNRPITLETKQFDTLEEADKYAKSKATALYKQLQTNNKYDHISFYFKVLDGLTLVSGYEIDIKNGKVNFVRLTKDVSKKYTDDERNFGVDILRTPYKENCKKPLIKEGMVDEYGNDIESAQKYWNNEIEYNLNEMIENGDLDDELEDGYTMYDFVQDTDNWKAGAGEYSIVDSVTDQILSDDWLWEQINGKIEEFIKETIRTTFEMSKDDMDEDLDKSKIKDIRKKTIKDNGGNFDPKTGDPVKIKNRFLVGIKDSGANWDKDIVDVDETEFEDAVNKAQSNVTDPNNEVIGTWSDEKHTDGSSVDTTRRFKNKRIAKKFAKKGEQKAMGKTDSEGNYAKTYNLKYKKKDLKKLDSKRGDNK